MRITSTVNLFTAFGRLVLVCGAFTAYSFASNTCDARTFNGSYDFTVTGFVLPALNIGEFGFGGGEGAVPIQGIQLITADGKGNLTDKESLSLGGSPLAATAANPFSNLSGTYTLESDCTGTAFLTNAAVICPSSPTNCPNANFLNLAFIINKTGMKVRMVAIPPYDSGGIERVITSIGEKSEL
jgi:hypothetical protein